MTETQEEKPHQVRSFGSIKAFSLLLLFGLPILIQLIGFVFPGYYLWSQSFLGLLPTPVAIALLVLAALTLIPLLKIQPDDNPAIDSPLTLNWPLSTLLLILLTTLFYFLRSRAMAYGDGYMILSYFTANQTGIVNVEGYLKGLSLIFHQQVFSLIKLVINLKPGAGFALINCIGGAVAVLGLFRLCGTIATNRYQQILLFVIALSSGATILFFGHIEYYTWPTALYLWSLYFSLNYLKSGQGLWLAISCSLLAVLFHILTLPCLLIAIMVFFIRNRSDDQLQRYFNLINITFGLFVLSFLVALIAQLTNLPQWLMLIYPIDDVPYWFLSTDRLIDLFNHLLLVSPFGIAAIIVFLFTKKKTENSTPIEQSVIGIAALLSFLVFFWIEPKLGMARDFDFTTFYAYPLTIWAVASLFGHNFNKTLFWRTLPAAIMTGLLILGPNLYEKQSAERAATNLDRILWDSPHHQIEYGNARRAMVWGVTILDKADMIDLAERNFQRRLEAKPDDFSSWYNLGHIYFNNKQFDTAAFCFSKAVEHNQSNFIYLARLAETELKSGRIGAAMKHIEQATQLAPTEYNVQFLAGLIYQQGRRIDAALKHFRIAKNLNQHSSDPAGYIGLIYFDQKILDSAYYYLNYSLAKEPMNQSLYPSLIRCNIELGSISEAEHVFRIYKQIAPNADDLNLIESLIDSAREETEN